MTVDYHQYMSILYPIELTFLGWEKGLRFNLESNGKTNLSSEWAIFHLHYGLDKLRYIQWNDDAHRVVLDEYP